MVLEMARIRGWRVEWVPIKMRPDFSGVALTGYAEREAFYRVHVPMGPNHAAGIWEIENDARGVNRLIGLLTREAAS